MICDVDTSCFMLQYKENKKNNSHLFVCLLWAFKTRQEYYAVAYTYAVAYAVYSLEICSNFIQVQVFNTFMIHDYLIFFRNINVLYEAISVSINSVSL